MVTRLNSRANSQEPCLWVNTGRILQKYREEYEFSQAEFAKACEMSAQYLGLIERGSRRITEKVWQRLTIAYRKKLTRALTKDLLIQITTPHH